MKSFILTSIFILWLQTKRDKLEVVVASSTENILTLGVENPLEALIEKCSKNEVFLTTNNGLIGKTIDHQFYIIPNQVGIAKINVCKIIKKDTIVIDYREFRVHRLPEPIARIGMINSGPLKKNFLITQGGIIARLECCGFDAPVQILEYTLIGMRDSSTIGTTKNIGARYTAKSIELLNRLQTGDRLIVCGLTSKLISQASLLHPMEFIIEE